MKVDNRCAVLLIGGAGISLAISWVTFLVLLAFYIVPGPLSPQAYKTYAVTAFLLVISLYFLYVCRRYGAPALRALSAMRDPDSIADEREVLRSENLQTGQCESVESDVVEYETPLKRGEVAVRPLPSAKGSQKLLEGIPQEARNVSVVTISAWHGNRGLMLELHPKEEVLEYVFGLVSDAYGSQSSRGIKFFNWYCRCCVGIEGAPARRKKRGKRKGKRKGNGVLFLGFPSLWIALSECEQGFLESVGHYRVAWQVGQGRPSTLDAFGVREEEVSFLEAMRAEAPLYVLDESDYADYVRVRKVLERILAVTYLNLNSESCNVLSPAEVIERVKEFLDSDPGVEREHLVDDPESDANFQRRIIKGTSLTNSLTRAFHSCILDLRALCDESLTQEGLNEINRRRGLGFCAAASLMLPYFTKSKAHKLMLKGKDRDYLNFVSEFASKMRVFNAMNDGPKFGGFFSRMSSYESTELPLLVEDEQKCRSYISSRGYKVRRLLEDFTTFELIAHRCGWRDGTVVKFFAYLQVWLQEAKELSLVRMAKPLEEQFKSFPDVLRHSFRTYWGGFETDGLPSECEDLRCPLSFCSDRIRFTFVSSSFQESLTVSRGLLPTSLKRLAPSRQERDETTPEFVGSFAQKVVPKAL